MISSISGSFAESCFRYSASLKDSKRELSLAFGKISFRFTSEMPLVHDAELLGEKFNLTVGIRKLGIGMIQL